MHSSATAQTPDITPLISVVVPFYNVEECVADCLDSLINQTFDSYEVVCIDDGSTDGTAQLLDDYAALHANVRVFHFENAGLSVARNRGVELAQAELISFVDGDDFVSPYYLSALYEAYDNVPGRMAQAKRFKDTREVLKKTDWPDRPSSTNLQILSGNDLKRSFLLGELSVAAWARLAHRSLYETVPFTPGMVYEDRVCMPDIIEHVSEVAILDQAIYAYVIREGSICKPKEMAPEIPRDYLCALRHIAEVASRWDNETRDALSWKLSTMALEALALSMEIPDRNVSRPYVQEAANIIRRQYARTLGTYRSGAFPWRLTAHLTLVAVSPTLYQLLRRMKRCLTR